MGCFGGIVTVLLILISTVGRHNLCIE